MSVEVRRTGEDLELELTGEWVAERFAALETALASVDLAAAQQLSIGTRRLTALDLSGAWVLRRFVRRARAAGAAVRFPGTQPDQLRLLDETLKEEGLGAGARSPAARSVRAGISTGHSPSAGAWPRRSWRACRSRGGCARSRSPATYTTPASPPCRSWRSSPS